MGKIFSYGKPRATNNSMAPYLVYQKKFSVALINWELLQQEDKAKQKKEEVI